MQCMKTLGKLSHAFDCAKVSFGSSLLHVNTFEQLEREKGNFGQNLFEFGALYICPNWKLDY